MGSGASPYAGVWHFWCAASKVRMLHKMMQIFLTCSSETADPIITLISIVPVTLRLSQLPGLWIPQLALIAEELVQLLLRSEKRINVIESYHKHPQATCSSTWPPYHAAVVHDSHHPESLLRVWGESVESLWQVLMICENRTAAWDIVTSRLLIWRAIVGEEGSEIGEWARREVVRNIGRN